MKKNEAITNREASRVIRPVGCAVLALSAVPLWLACLLISSLVLQPREQRTIAQGWPEVPCLIQKLSIKTHKVGRHGKPGRTKTDVAFSPLVSYEYEFDGQVYTGDRFWLGGTLFNTSQEVEEIIAPYQEGAATICYVNPQEPQESILSRQLYDEEWVGWWWLVVFGLVGAAGCTAAMGAIFFPRGWRQPHGGLVPASRGELIGGWIAALAWNGLFGALFVRACLRGLPWSNLVELFGFPILGLLLLVAASLKTWQYCRAG